MKSLAKAGMGMLPKPIRHRIYRSMLAINPTPPPQLCVRLAQNREELECAFRLLHDVYVKEGFMKPHPSGIRVTVYHALPSTSTIVALWENKVVGTISVIRSNPLKLPLEKVFNTDPLRANGSRTAEISSLAIQPNFRGNKGEILFPLLKFLYNYCVDYFGVDNKLIAINPRHADFYEAILFFKSIEAKVEKNYDFANGHPAIGRFLNLRTAFEIFAAKYGGKTAEKNLFHYFCYAKFPNLQFPDREFFKVSDPVMTPELLEYFFVKKTDTFTRLTDHEKILLHHAYRAEKYRKVLPVPQVYYQMEKQRSRRFEVKCRGKISLPGGDRSVSILVENVSRKGFAAVLNDAIRFGTEVEVTIAVGEFDVASLVAIPVWSKSGEVYGFQVRKSNKNWQNFLNYLEHDQNPRRGLMNPKNNLELVVTPPTLSAVGVSKIYPMGETTISALKDIHLSIQKGEFLALAGSSGSGKTTLLNLLGCLDKVSEGRICVDGVDVSSLNSDELAQFRGARIGFIFQTFNLLPLLSAAENVEYPLLLLGVPARLRQDKVKQMLAEVGLENHMNHRPSQLSGGQRQRVAIARAMVKKPSIILADEPTANLDKATAAGILDLMREINLKAGVTFVFSSHDPELISRAKRVIHICDGKIDSLKNKLSEIGEKYAF